MSDILTRRFMRTSTAASPDNFMVNPSRTGFWLLIGLLALFAGGKVILADTLDPDCFWHLRVADQLHRQGIGPIVDELSFASTRQPWTPYSWLAELGMKLIFDHGGYRLAVLVAAGMSVAIAVLLALSCLEAQQYRTPVTAAEAVTPNYLNAVLATAAGLFFTLPYLSFRPVTAAFVLLFAMVFLLLRDQRLTYRSRALWLVIPSTVLLTNIHLFSLFVPLGITVLGVGALLDRNQKAVTRYAYLAFATTLACLATPMLPGMVRTVFFYSSADRMVSGPVISEMQSFARGPSGAVAAVLLVIMLLCVLYHHERVNIGMLICSAGVTVLIFKLGRFAPFFAMIVCPLFAAAMPRLNDRLLARPPMVVTLALVLIVGIVRVATAFPTRSTSISAWLNRNGPEAPGYPCAAADFVDRKISPESGHLINEFSWGGYLAWRLGSRYQVLLDGRTQVYPGKLWQETYLGSEQEKLKFLSTVTADAAVLPAGNSRFRDNLKKLGWTAAYQDDRAQVWVPPATQASVRE